VKRPAKPFSAALPGRRSALICAHDEFIISACPVPGIAFEIADGYRPYG
jgi:hypothetical protein